ncbi:MAG: helix-turn-helix domain-containing protein [Rhodoglobus sp.]
MKKEEFTARSHAFARAIKGALEESELTRQQVIDALDFSASTFDRITAGTKIPSVSQVWTIADALGIEPGLLYQRSLALLGDPIDAKLRRAGLTEKEIDGIRRARASEPKE